MVLDLDTDWAEVRFRCGFVQPLGMLPQGCSWEAVRRLPEEGSEHPAAVCALLPCALLPRLLEFWPDAHEVHVREDPRPRKRLKAGAAEPDKSSERAAHAQR